MLNTLKLLLVAALILGVSAGCSLVNSPADDEAQFNKDQLAEVEPEPAEEFEGELLDGEEAAFADYKGKPVILNFWASWCAPCRKEMPEFIEAYEMHGDDIQFVGVNFRDTRAPANTFYDEFEVPYESFFDQSGKIGFSYGVRVLPVTVFIDADGTIIGRKLGAVSRDELDEGINLLLDES